MESGIILYNQIKMKQRNLTILLTGILFLMSPIIKAQSNNPQASKDKLVVVWTSDDPMVAERVALMYTHAAKTAGWFNEVTLIIWGPSARLISENIKLQEKLREMQKDGVVIEACIACANAYGVAEDLKKLGYVVKGMGIPLTDYLKSGAKVLTF
jgi:hypothetical protein